MLWPIMLGTLLLAGAPSARAATDAAPSKVEPARQAKAAPDLTPLLSRLYCPDTDAGSWVVHENRSLADCDTTQGRNARDLLTRAAAQDPQADPATPEGRTRLLRALITEDPRADRLLRVPAATFDEIWHHTHCLCGCSHILFQCGLECGPAADWKGRFRRMLAAGFTKDQALDIYVSFWNERLPPSAEPYNRERVTKDPGMHGTWAFPAIVGFLFLTGLIIMLLRRRSRPALGPGQADMATAIEGKAELDEIADELIEETGNPLE